MVMGERLVQPLYYYPPGADLGAIRDRFVAMNLGLKVQPYSAVEHGSTRILAIGEKPDWLCDYVYISGPNDINFDQAMLWALHLVDLESGPTTVLWQLRKVMGEGVMEID